MYNQSLTSGPVLQCRSRELGCWCVLSPGISFQVSYSSGTDEILYQAHVHPEQRANALTDTQLMKLHSKTVDVCHKAVEVNADSSRFPEDWLFKHRWVCHNRFWLGGSSELFRIGKRQKSSYFTSRKVTQNFLVYLGWRVDKPLAKRQSCNYQMGQGWRPYVSLRRRTSDSVKTGYCCFWCEILVSYWTICHLFPGQTWPVLGWRINVIIGYRAWRGTRFCKAQGRP